MKLLGAIDSPACAPIPVIAIFSGEFAALLTTVIDPVTLPPVVGANDTFSGTRSAGLRVPGTSTPLVVRPAPSTVMDEIVTPEFPKFVNTICCSALVPVATDPKLTLFELAFNWPVAVLVPVPLSATFIVGFAGSLLAILKLPVALPAAGGEKVTATWADCPVVRVVGVVIPLTLKSVPARASREIFRFAAPVLVSTKLFVAFKPVDTLPKFRAAEFSDSCGCEVTPVADKSITTGVLSPSACAVSIAVNAPAVVGFTEIVKFDD